MPTPLMFMHDGAVDELICIPFLQAMPNVNLSGIWITPSDCLAVPTATVCGQLLNFINNTTTGLTYTETGSQRPFPWTYRQYALMVNLLPFLNPPTGQVIPSARKICTRNGMDTATAMSVYDQIKQATDAAGEAMIFLITSPMTDFAMLLDLIPGFASEVASITWMGGSINAGGNIDTGIAIGANPNAEWNAYWDPYSVAQVLQAGITINMFPLDVTNQFVLTTSILQQYFLPLAASSQMINLACQMYALVAFQNGYSFWDTATAAYLGNPSLFTLTPTAITINLDETDFNGFGCITTTNGPANVNIASTSQVSQFYQYLTNRLASLR